MIPHYAALRIAEKSINKAQTTVASSELIDIDKELINLILDDPVDCDPQVRQSFTQLFHQTFSTSPAEVNDLEWYMLPYGSLAPQGFQHSKLVPKTKFAGSKRSLQNSLRF